MKSGPALRNRAFKDKELKELRFDPTHINARVGLKSEVDIVVGIADKDAATRASLFDALEATPHQRQTNALLLTIRSHRNQSMPDRPQSLPPMVTREKAIWPMMSSSRLRQDNACVHWHHATH